MKALAYYLFLAWIFFAGLSCGPSDSSWTGSVRDSAGIQIMENPAEGLWTTGTPWSLNVALRIGAADGDPNYQFGSIGGIAPVGDELFVLDQQAGIVRVFDKAGQFVRSFGGLGKGPGEIGPGAGPLIAITQDIVFIQDPTNQRMSRFDAEGTNLGSVPLELSAFPVKWERSDDGKAVKQLRTLFNAQGGPVSSNQADFLVLVGTDAQPLDTLLTMPRGGTFNTTAGGRPEFNFFSPEPFWTTYPNQQIIFGINNEYRFGIYDRDGSLKRLIGKPGDLREVGDRDREKLTEAVAKTFREQFSNAGFSPTEQQMQALLGGVSFADRYPAYLQFLTGPEGSIWVQQIQDMRELDLEDDTFNPLTNLGSRSWDVFSTEGHFNGTLDMPDRFQPLGFDGNRLLGVFRDDLDVQYVMIVEILGSGT